MVSIKTISFVDADSGDEGMVGVRVEEDLVALAMSLRLDGDMEVFIRRPQVEALIEALKVAQEMLPRQPRNG
jgi:hypothetical protein